MSDNYPPGVNERDIPGVYSEEHIICPECKEEYVELGEECENCGEYCKTEDESREDEYWEHIDQMIDQDRDK